MTSYCLYLLTVIIAVSFGLLLSDLPTPSFIIDMDVLKKSNPSQLVPKIYLPQFKLFAEPHSTNGLDTVQFDYDNALSWAMSERKLGYLHARVIRTKSEDGVIPTNSNFLAELDLVPSMCVQELKNSPTNECIARLVQGLNNHHVGSYYWARSAGLGSSMIAIGVKYGDIENDRGNLEWEHDSGPIVCNSNDGKRSEWVNFLKVGDTVQLVPSFGQEAMMQFLTKTCNRVYGVQKKDRPLGSEPLVICKFKLG